MPYMACEAVYGALQAAWGGPVVSDQRLDVVACGYQMMGMPRRMDEQVGRQVARTLTKGLDASTRDLAAGRVGDAGAAQREARRTLEAFEKARAGAKGGKRKQTA